MEQLLRERLGLIEHWLRGMVRQDTGQFAYLYQPEADRVEGNSPIRDIATVRDAELLARFGTEQPRNSRTEKRAGSSGWSPFGPASLVAPACPSSYGE